MCLLSAGKSSFPRELKNVFHDAQRRWLRLRSSSLRYILFSQIFFIIKWKLAQHRNRWLQFAIFLLSLTLSSYLPWFPPLQIHYVLKPLNFCTWLSEMRFPPCVSDEKVKQSMYSSPWFVQPDDLLPWSWAANPLCVKCFILSGQKCLLCS